MPFLEILHSNGTTERRELEKQFPITIGKHPSNDIVIDEDGIAVVHCRISWKKGKCEAAAATGESLDVNGTQKKRTALAEGDLLRFGSVDIRYMESENGNGSPEIENSEGKTHSGGPKSAEPRQKNRSTASRKSEEDSMGNSEQFFSGLDQLADESRSETAPPPSGSHGEPVSEKPPLSTPDAHPKEKPVVPPSSSQSPVPPVDDPLTDRMRQAMRSQRNRPGEEDPLRSPLVLGLSGLAVALLLTGAIFYFIATRQTTHQAFDVARQAYDEGNYRASIVSLQEFIANHTPQKLTVEAQQLLGFSRIRQLIDSAAPKYADGLKQLREFIDEQKDLDEFESLHGDIMEHARTISLGAAIAAGKQFDPELLEVSKQARTLVKTYAPKDSPPVETLSQIQQAQRASQALILRDDVYDDHLAKIDAALASDDPLQALRLRRQLLIRYPDFDRDKKVAERMQSTLTAERDRTTFEEMSVSAETTDHEWPRDVLTLAFQGRTKIDEVSTGQAVLVLAQDCCFGVEQVTGEPIWRRVIGFETPFFPLLEPGQPTAILFDTNYQEVVRLDQNTGKLLWRLPISEAVTGKPLLSGDTLYVSTLSGKLLSIDVVSGALTGTLSFSQPISGAVELQDEQWLVVAGNQEVLYTLTKRPLACVGIFDLGQAAASIQAPLLSVADYLVVLENANQHSTLQLLKVGSDPQSMSLAASASVPGRVFDAPVIRGRDLFVPSTGERVSAFSLSDDAGQPPLVSGPVYVSEGKEIGSAFLLTGPDRQLWMATSGLSRLRLTTGALQQDGDPIATGNASQPLQYLSGFLFHARRRPFTSAVTVTRTDRDEMKSDWQAVLGGAIAAWSVTGTENPTICAVTDAGLAYRISGNQITSHQFQSDASTRLPLNAQLRTPLQIGVAAGNRLAVACGGPEPKLWIINPAGQVEKTVNLSAAPQAPPSGLGDATLVPLEGSVEVIRSSGQPPVQAFALPTGEKQTWVSVTPLGEEQAAAVTADGTILLLRLNPTPQPHLGEVARVELGHPVKLRASSGEDLFAIVDQSHRLSLFDLTRLEPRGSQAFPKAITSPPRIAGGRIFVEEAQQQWHCLDPAEELKTVWSIPLQGTSVVGVLLHEGSLHVALQSGDVLVLDPANGKETKRFHTLNALAEGPFLAGENLYVTTADGSLIRMQSE